MWFAFVEGGLSLAGATRGKRTRSGKAKGVLGHVKLKQLVLQLDFEKKPFLLKFSWKHS